MKDYVFPKDNEKELLEMAGRLGIEELCFVYSELREPPKIKSKVKISTAVICERKDIRKFKGKIETIIKAPESIEEVRKIVEQDKPDMILDLEPAQRKDFIHHRGSGLNQVLCKLMADNGVKLGISFSAILASKEKRRAQLLGRIAQNLKFAKKFKFEIVLGSFVSEPYQMRSEDSLNSLKSSL